MPARALFAPLPAFINSIGDLRYIIPTAGVLRFFLEIPALDTRRLAS